MDNATHKMSCGACGYDRFQIGADHSTFPTILVFKCLNCKSITIYRIETPRMKQDWGENSEGVTCFMGE